MNDFLARVASLSEDKRRLLNLLLRREPIERPDLPQPYEAPRTDLEQTLAGIWSRVLGVDGIGIHDHFIELGGDSILAIQVLAMARDAGVQITAKQLFDTPTIAGLADALAGETATVPVTP